MRTMLVLLAAVALSGCSSSFGSGGSSSQPRREYIVVPSGQRLVCNDGSEPPCR